MFFFFNETATTEIYPLPLHDALPIWVPQRGRSSRRRSSGRTRHPASRPPRRSQAANVAAAVKPDAEYGLTTDGGWNALAVAPRSEERRVGEEGRSRWSPSH